MAYETILDVEDFEAIGHDSYITAILRCNRMHVFGFDNSSTAPDRPWLATFVIARDGQWHLERADRLRNTNHGTAKWSIERHPTDDRDVWLLIYNQRNNSIGKLVIRSLSCKRNLIAYRYGPNIPPEDACVCRMYDEWAAVGQVLTSLRYDNILDIAFEIRHMQTVAVITADTLVTVDGDGERTIAPLKWRVSKILAFRDNQVIMQCADRDGLVQYNDKGLYFVPMYTTVDAIAPLGNRQAICFTVGAAPRVMSFEHNRWFARFLAHDLPWDDKFRTYNGYIVRNPSAPVKYVERINPTNPRARDRFVIDYSFAAEHVVAMRTIHENIVWYIARNSASQVILLFELIDGKCVRRASLPVDQTATIKFHGLYAIVVKPPGPMRVYRATTSPVSIVEEPRFSVGCPVALSYRCNAFVCNGTSLLHHSTHGVIYLVRDGHVCACFSSSDVENDRTYIYDLLAFDRANRLYARDKRGAIVIYTISTVGGSLTLDRKIKYRVTADGKFPNCHLDLASSVLFIEPTRTIPGFNWIPLPRCDVWTPRLHRLVVDDTQTKIELLAMIRHAGQPTGALADVPFELFKVIFTAMLYC